MKARPGIAGVGCAVPSRILTNADLEKLVDTSDEWITARTGIKERRILREDEDPAELGIAAARGAIEHAGLDPTEIDFLITATNVPEMLVPGSSPFICEGLKIKKEIPFFDLIAGCTGFVYALKVAADLVSAGSYENVLVVGLEALSRFTDWQDRSTCVLFGDGAGAVVVRKMPPGRGILASCLAADSSKWSLLRIDAGGVKTPASVQTVERRQHYLKMAGSEVFKSAVQMMEETTEKALKEAQLTKYEIDWVVPHQANLRIITALAKRLDIPMEKVIVNIDRYANTSTASIPIALREAVDDGRIQPGDVVVLSAFGAGVTYGSIVLRW
ncbi:MAG: ketoacyl-ACP synthase III [Candidatus Bipolaricaulota bacterium]|nr:ketoacyl-ACP synthase III [Candidatus Bipolaricaulota bacterium]MCS7275288.1 ketoacyl-ACP synthase III [Candidatus Bipolaricaulota bacterium]MDW8111532.1 beta-ketoacyl-ACP synthase III [Candidatus Bipolaricaulota bacterium]MDW8329420.1 beta-ketoacyl-ACP synthase III [Candidatus Bipolaricaulota bacterium]